ncbi:MAG TPA: RidA family protein [Chloroflexota bacterium]|nr:RidA family protein [Chloroflexota bacterium]
MAKEVLRSDKLAAPVGVFSQAVKVPARGHFIYVSGLTSRAPDGTTHAPGDVREQTRRILENLKLILAEGGATLDDVVRVVVYIRDMADFKAIHEVRAQYFTHDPPASTMVEVSRLVNDDMLIEIEATALVSD